jgi:two-component system, response regulator PdtaR
MAESELTGRRVLIAEDEAIIRMDLREMLEEEGYDICGEAADGRKAVDLARQQQPDLVILDIKMPGMSGIRAAEIITRERIAPVLILTAFSQRDLAAQAAQAGAMAYVVKPFQKSDLLPAIEVALGRYQDVERLEGAVGELEGRLQARKTIERAKGILQEQGLSEDDAYKLLQRAAMDRSMQMVEVAQLVIEGRFGEADGKRGS